mmetsp:Transcript_48905/g.116249  ORF Transcript_48905/g.116249 Transcript_48905/m.116249 type:complete len:256 (-) Transcript_48905:120-887(-)
MVDRALGVASIAIGTAALAISLRSARSRSRHEPKAASQHAARAEAEVMSKLEQAKVVPVVAVPAAEKAVKLAEALVAGGLDVIEVVFRTAAAEESIRLIAANVPSVLVGAGTVLSPEQADIAVRAGARFIVSPGLNPEVVEWCRAKGVPVLPGVATPTEVEAAMRLGLKNMKFFPAETNGGAAALKAICAPYAGLRFMPTGGVTEKNLASYLSMPQVVAIGGTWMVPAQAVEAGDFAKIQSLAESAAALAKECRP